MTDARIKSIFRNWEISTSANAFPPSRICTVTRRFFVTMYSYHPLLLAKSSMEKQYFSHGVNVVSDGDPLEIYTNHDGGVIFKKYSQLGGITDFAGQLCEALSRTAGQIAVITDRDSCIAVGGVPRRELVDKRISPRLETLMEARQSWQSAGERIPVCEDTDKYRVVTAVPILSEGDVLGCVLFISADESTQVGEVELKLAQAVAGFLGKHMES